jgi:hypothetical protein
MLRSIADESGSNKVGPVDEQEAGVDCTQISNFSRRFRLKRNRATGASRFTAERPVWAQPEFTEEIL